MAFELTTVLLGVCVGAAVVLYAAPKGYLGHRRRRGSSAEVLTNYTSATEQVVVAPAAEAPAAAELAPSPAPAFYETVQPNPSPAPVTYAASSAPTFGGSTVARKATKTYRRRTAPSRSAAPAKSTHPAKAKKR